LNPEGISLTVTYGDLERRFELRRENNFAIVQRYNDEEKL
jgi:hypothetical protein